MSIRELLRKQCNGTQPVPAQIIWIPEKVEGAGTQMKRIQMIVIAWIACWTFVVSGQEYELESLTAARAVRQVAESEEGAEN